MVGTKIRGFLALGLLASFGALLIPACKIRIGPGDDDSDPWTSSGDESEGGGGIDPGGAAGSEPTQPENETDTELLARVDPEELAFATAKATVATCALNGTLDALPLDPASLDEATLLALMEQYMPAAVEQTDLWLESVSSSSFPPAPIPKYECEGDYGCQLNPKCKYGFDPGVNHQCVIVDCGPSRCSWCPSWVLEILNHLVYKNWCAYVCVQTGTTNAPTVAVAAGGVSSFGGYFVGPICAHLW
jgi:hypothetical protein